MKSESDDKEQTEGSLTRAGSEDRVEAKIDRDLKDSFPASDPPGWVLGVGPRDVKEEEEDAGDSPSGAAGDKSGG